MQTTKRERERERRPSLEQIEANTTTSSLSFLSYFSSPENFHSKPLDWRPPNWSKPKQTYYNPRELLIPNPVSSTWISSTSYYIQSKILDQKNEALHNIQKKKSSRGKKKICFKGDSNDPTQDLHFSSTFIHSCISLLFLLSPFKFTRLQGLYRNLDPKYSIIIIFFFFFFLLLSLSVYQHFLLFLNSVQKLIHSPPVALESRSSSKILMNTSSSSCCSCSSSSPSSSSSCYSSS